MSCDVKGLSRTESIFALLVLQRLREQTSDISECKKNLGIRGELHLLIQLCYQLYNGMILLQACTKTRNNTKKKQPKRIHRNGLKGNGRTEHTAEIKSSEMNKLLKKNRKVGGLPTGNKKINETEPEQDSGVLNG